MRLEPVDGEGQPVGGGRPGDQLIDAVHVEHQAPARAQPAGVEVLGAEEPRFLADRDDDLEVP
jgi:hypothetical protein